MKTTHSLLILMAVMSLMACKQDVEQKCPDPVTKYSNRVHVITLYVNTNIDDKNSFEYANFGQKDGIPNKDFEIYVRKGDIVIWEGVSKSDSSDVVNIKSIKYEALKENEKSTNFIGKESLRGNGGKNELVVGAILNGNIGDTMIYSVEYSVQKKGEDSPETLHIDPKMHM